MSTEAIQYYEKALRHKVPYQFQNVSWELPEGWIMLIAILSGLIDERLDQEGLRGNARKAEIFGGFSQIKEKFGGARIYCHYLHCEKNKALEEDIRKLIAKAEILSIRICIECGAIGDLKNVGGWRVPLCERHYQAANR